MSDEEDNNSDWEPSHATALQTPALRIYQSPWPPSAPPASLPSPPPPDPALRQIDPPGSTHASLLQRAERHTLLMHQMNREVEGESSMAPSALRSRENRLKRRQLGTALGAGANQYDVVDPNNDKLCTHGWVVFEPDYESRTRPAAALPDKAELCRNAVVHSLHYFNIYIAPTLAQPRTVLKCPSLLCAGMD